MSNIFRKIQRIVNNTKFKTTIASIAGALVVFSLSKGFIDGDTATFISSILVSLGFGANIISYKK